MNKSVPLLIVYFGVCASLTGCVTAERWSDDTIQCEKDPRRQPAIHISRAFQLSSEELACFGSTLRVQCDLVHTITESDQAACRLYASALSTYLRRSACAIVQPSATAPITYSKGGVCIDTFIPGREAADCFDFVEAHIPLEKVEKPGHNQPLNAIAPKDGAPH